MRKRLIVFANLLLICICALALCSCAPKGSQSTTDTTPPPPPNSEQKSTLGVWWWQDDLDSSYLDFAEAHQVTEIYYCTSSFDGDTAKFISAANAKGIQVYLLDGDYRWINDCDKLYQVVENYIDYQQSHEEKFAGIHLDIEPHQSPDFHDNRDQILTDYAQLIYQLRDRYPDIYFEYDIPFWLDDSISVNGKSKPLYEHIIDLADRVTVMSYRDSANAIYNVAKEEISYAKSIGKVVNLSVETGNTGEDIVDFAEEGVKYMYEQLKSVHTLAPNCGIAIHDIRHWKNLK